MKKKLINTILIYIILFIFLINKIDKKKSWYYLKKNYNKLKNINDFLFFPIYNIIIVIISFIIANIID